MVTASKVITSVVDDVLKAYGPRDSESVYSNSKNKVTFTGIKNGIVDRFNVGMYSAIVKTNDSDYLCSVGTLNITSGFGYSDATVLHEGDDVLISVISENRREGIILAKKPQRYSVDDMHQSTIESETKLERRTSFFSNDCYRKENQIYDDPLKNPDDITTARYLESRPTDLVHGETGLLNQHNCGTLFNQYSASIYGGGSHIRLYSLENKIRIVADSIIKHTLFGNEEIWHNRRYLSKETGSCMYQEERLGMKEKDVPAFVKSDYDKDFYFIKNKKKKQTQNPRLKEIEGYFGSVSSRYVLRPDPDRPDVRVMDDKLKDPGVMRESIDPSGQYRMAATGMLGFERVGRIPVPIRTRYPWHNKADEPEAKKLEEFKHSENHPYYRQLELADRVAFDVKNSYSRLDEAETEFFVPEEQDLKGKVKDVYDPGFTESTTVKLEKYDKRRSGIWQGEDGSIILRDAWGSEIVMIGGNIQLSCAGNIEILPGKTALTLAGDDIVNKAQNSIDIESADKDVRINAFKNMQILAGVDDEHPGGVTIEAKGRASQWDADAAGGETSGGEGLSTKGIVIKSPDSGAVSIYGGQVVLRSEEKTSIVSGKKDDDAEGTDLDISAGKGEIYISSQTVREYGHDISVLTDDAVLWLKDTAMLAAENIVVAGRTSTAITKGDEFLVPLMWAPGDKNIANDVLTDIEDIVNMMRDELVVSLGYTQEKIDKMHFKFRSSEECSTTNSWELEDAPPFKLYEPFWIQVINKFETLKNVDKTKFEDHIDLWDDKYGNPWPGSRAVAEAKYAMLESGEPVNLDKDGFNKPRKEDGSIKNESPVIEEKLFPGYLIRN